MVTMPGKANRGRAARLLGASALASAGLVLGLAARAGAAPAGGAGHGGHAGFQVSPVRDVSGACAGPNAEVVQGAGKPHYVYEAWIGCAGEGFARSTDGGLHFQKPIKL